MESKSMEIGEIRIQWEKQGEGIPDRKTTAKAIRLP